MVGEKVEMRGGLLAVWRDVKRVAYSDYKSVELMDEKD